MSFSSLFGFTSCNFTVLIQSKCFSRRCRQVSSVKKALINQLYTTCPALNGRHTKLMVNIEKHLAAKVPDISLRRPDQSWKESKYCTYVCQVTKNWIINGCWCSNASAGYVSRQHFRHNIFSSNDVSVLYLELVAPSHVTRGKHLINNLLYYMSLFATCTVTMTLLFRIFACKTIICIQFKTWCIVIN